MFNETIRLIARIRPASGKAVSGRRSPRTAGTRWLPALVIVALANGCATVDQQAKPPPTELARRFAPAAVAPQLPAEPGAELAAPVSSRPVSSGLAASRTYLNLHLFGLSYHPDRQGVRDSQMANELNFGLGLNYEFRNDGRGVTSTETGIYKDSGNHWAKFVGLGYQFRLSENWRLGGDVLLVQSSSYNQGNIFFAPIPHLSVDVGGARINAIYIPKFQQYNLFSVFALYLTIPLKSW